MRADLKLLGRGYMSSLVIRVACSILLLAIVFLLSSYAASLLLLHLYHLPLAEATPFKVWDYFSVYAHHSRLYIRLTVNGCALLPFAITALFVPLALMLLKGKGRSLHGDARFATRREQVAAGLLEPKSCERTILVGRQGDEYLSFGGYQFVLLAAPSRSGKGVGMVVPNCLNYSDSLVVLDIKYENFELSSGFRAAHGQEVYLFAPFDEQGRTHRYNPLEYISEDPASRLGDVDAIAAALYNNPISRDKFFDEQA